MVLAEPTDEQRAAERHSQHSSYPGAPSQPLPVPTSMSGPSTISQSNERALGLYNSRGEVLARRCWRCQLVNSSAPANAESLPQASPLPARKILDMPQNGFVSTLQCPGVCESRVYEFNVPQSQNVFDVSTQGNPSVPRQIPSYATARGVLSTSFPAQLQPIKPVSCFGKLATNISTPSAYPAQPQQQSQPQQQQQNTLLMTKIHPLPYQPPIIHPFTHLHHPIHLPMQRFRHPVALKFPTLASFHPQHQQHQQHQQPPGPSPKPSDDHIFRETFVRVTVAPAHLTIRVLRNGLSSCKTTADFFTNVSQLCELKAEDVAKAMVHCSWWKAKQRLDLQRGNEQCMELLRGEVLERGRGQAACPPREGGREVKRRVCDVVVWLRTK